MKRRKLINLFGLATTSALAACARSPQIPGANVARVVTQPRIQWRMATSWPESLDIVYGNAKLIGDRISELTQGNFTITTFPAGGITPTLEILETIQNGDVECGHTAGYYYTSLEPALAFATSVPFGLSPAQHQAWLYGGGGLELIRQLYADFNTINFPAGSSGNQMGGWFKKKIATPEELKGLKMRMPGLGGRVMERLGVEISNLPPAEIAPAIERGDLDAAEWICPYDDERLGLNRAAPFYYYPGWHEPGTTFELLVNRASWERLPKEYQQALATASFEAHTRMLSLYDAANNQALRRLIAGGTELIPYSNAILDRARQATTDLLSGLASSNENFRQVYREWDNFRRGIYAWNSINERSFANYIFGEG